MDPWIEYQEARAAYIEATVELDLAGVPNDGTALPGAYVRALERLASAAMWWAGTAQRVREP